MNYRKMHNDELIDLLFTEEDRLPKSAVDEIVRRADELLPALTGIALDRVLWTADLPDWWAPVHATYILGAIGTEETIMPLLASLRWADAYDNEWITEDLPSIFGSIGMPARRPLEKIVADHSAGWSARAIAMDGLTALSLRFPELEEEIVRMIAAILSDAIEELGARRAAATILMDLKRADCKRALIAFAKEERERFKNDPDISVAFSARDVEKELSISRRDTAYYLHDWMSFYEQEEIRNRQRRWAEEEATYRLRPQLHPSGASLEREEGRRVRLEDPCPCGSGKTYRRCCWQKIH